jgi:hypothetical protein
VQRQEGASLTKNIVKFSRSDHKGFIALEEEQHHSEERMSIEGCDGAGYDIDMYDSWRKAGHEASTLRDVVDLKIVDVLQRSVTAGACSRVSRHKPTLENYVKGSVGCHEKDREDGDRAWSVRGGIGVGHRDADGKGWAVSVHGGYSRDGEGGSDKRVSVHAEARF